MDLNNKNGRETDLAGKMRYCPNCGFKIPAGVKYCPNCGTALVRFDAQIAAQTAARKADRLSKRSRKIRLLTRSQQLVSVLGGVKVRRRPVRKA